MLQKDIVDINQELICVYETLSQLIKKCDFNEKQLKVLYYYQFSFKEKYIAEMLNDTQQNITKIINTCCKNIAAQSHLRWLAQNIKKTKQKTKICSKCKKIKYYSEFSPDKRNKDGLQSFCKKCDNYRKKGC